MSETSAGGPQASRHPGEVAHKSVFRQKAYLYQGGAAEASSANMSLLPHSSTNAGVRGASAAPVSLFDVRQE